MPGDIIILQWCTKNHDHRLYCSWDMVCDRQNFSHFGPFFPFTPSPQPPPPPLNNPVMTILKKWKTTSRDIIISHKCTINDNHMINGSWDKFCLFSSLTTQKNDSWSKIKNHDLMLYCSWDMARDTWYFHFSFWAVFYPFIP